MRKLLKRAGIGIVAVLGLVVFIGLGAYARGQYRVIHKAAVHATTPAIPSDAASIERGRHIANAIAPCAGCHDVGLKGHMFDVPPALATMAAPNLTPGKGGVGALNSPADWDRAIRHGIGHDGRRLVIMPAHGFAHMSDADFGALVAYLRTLPPVDNVLPARKLGPLGALLIGAGKFSPEYDVVEKDHIRPSTAQPGHTAQYGEYLVQIATCADCHGPTLHGQTGGPAPSGPNLFVHAANWTEAQFRNTIRTGRTPEGRVLNGEHMPWPYFANMTDDELDAISLYLQSRR